MNDPIQSVQNPARLVLEGVPRVQFYEGGPRCPEDVCLPSVLRAILEFLGEEEYGCKHCLQKSVPKVFCTYSYMMGITGAAFFLSWKKGWEMDNGAVFYMSDDPTAPERSALNAVGYAHTWVTKEEGRDNEALFRQQITASLQKGHPVIGYGVIGPPEPMIITGIDEGGDVLLGWSFFQKFPEFAVGVDVEPSGYFRKRNWFPDTHSLLIIGEKQEKPALSQTYRDALQFGLKVTRTPIVRPEPDAPEWYKERANGLEAYQAWADQLLQDEDFKAGDEAVLRQRHDAHNNAVGIVAEERWYGGQFLIEAVNFLPYQMSEDLLHAAACYAGEHDLMWKVWDLAGGNGNPEAFRKLAEPEVRRQMVPIILQARDKDVEAANYIEQALGRKVS